MPVERPEDPFKGSGEPSGGHAGASVPQADAPVLTSTSSQPQPVTGTADAPPSQLAAPMTQAITVALAPGAPGRPAAGMQGVNSTTMQPAEFLAEILNRMAQIDKEGFFQIPVDEKLHHAPNYYSIIKNPICFLDMKRKMGAGGYTSFRQLREDFELICSNAKTFNKSSTKVYKAAGVLLSRGTKIIKQHELDIRKAFSIISPAAGAPVASGMSPSFSGAAIMPSAHESGHDRSASMDTAAGEATSAGGVLRGVAAAAGAADGAAGVASGQAHGDAHEAHPGDHMLPQPPMPPLCPYISDNEPDGTSEPRERLDKVLASVRSAATFEPWGERRGQPGASAASAHAAPPSMRLEPSGHSEDWRAARRPVEWQARWLELRLMELKAQRLQLRTRLAALQHRAPDKQHGGVDAGTTPGSEAGGASSSAAAAAVADSGAMSAPASALARERSTLSDAQLALAPAVHAAPFFRMRMGSRAHAAATPATAGASRAAEAPSTSHAPELPLAAPPSDPSLTPALIHASAELLGTQLASLRARLMDTFPALERTLAGAPGGNPGVRDIGGTTGRTSASRRASSGRLLGGAGGAPVLSVLTRADSTVKRRRTADTELGDLGSPLTRSADRQASAIFIPPVREISDDEQHARLVAATTWNEHFQLHGEVALFDMVPPDVEAVLVKDAGSEGSSSEDTSDEAYAQLHRVMEEEEHKRYAAVIAEGQRKKANADMSKAHGGPSKTPRGAGAGALAATPRRSSDDGPLSARASGHPPRRADGHHHQHHHHHHHQPHLPGHHHHHHHHHGNGGLSPHAPDGDSFGMLKRRSSGGGPHKARKPSAGAHVTQRALKRSRATARARGSAAASRKRRSDSPTPSWETSEGESGVSVDDSSGGSDDRAATEAESDERSSSEWRGGDGGESGAIESEDDSLAAMATRHMAGPRSGSGAGSPNQLQVPMVAAAPKGGTAPPVVVRAL